MLVAELPVQGAAAVVVAMAWQVVQAPVVLVNSTAVAEQPMVLKAPVVAVVDSGTSTTMLSLLGRASPLLSEPAQ